MRRKFRRSTRRRTKKGSKRVATKSYVKKYIARQQEHKYWDVTNSAAIDFSGVIYDLSLIPQGDTDISRDGDKLMPTSLYLNMKVEAGDPTNVMRVIVFRWKINSAAYAPTVADILAVTGSAYAPMSPYLHDIKSQFTVVKDLTFHVSSYNVFAWYKRTIRLAKRTIKYAGGTTSASDKLYMLVVSDSGTITHPSFTSYTRLNFTDS